MPRFGPYRRRQSIMSSFLLVTLALQLTWSRHDMASAAPFLKMSASLPEFMADFELNYNTGDIAAVSPNTNKAFLFRYDDIISATTAATSVTLSPSEELNVCTTPYSISYKMYQDMQDIVHSYYGIVCTQVNKVFVLDAVDFSLVAETQISGLSAASSIISSRNQRDPFFYFNYGSGYDSSLAIFDVRTMKDLGDIVMQPMGAVVRGGFSMDSSISADGKVIYTRDPLSGLTSIELATTDVWNQTEPTPTFKVLVDVRKSAALFVPDTVNEKTASGVEIFTKTLNEELAQLDFEVKCWGANSSYLFGFATAVTQSWEKVITGEILVASSETYQLIGSEAAILPDEFLIDTNTLPVIPRGVQGQADYKRMAFRRELIANDLHSELIAAFANQLGIIPYKCFEGGSVSFAPNSTDLFIGVGPQYIMIDEAEEQNVFDNDEISLTGLPEGAVFDSSERIMTWEPTEDQLGPHEVLILTEGTRACYFNITLYVSYPSTKLPFIPTGVSIADESNGLIVVWESSGNSQYYRVDDDDWDFPSSGVPPEQSKGAMSIVRLHGQPRLIVTKYFDFRIENVFATPERIVLAKTWDRQTTSQTFLVFDCEQADLLTTFTVNKKTYSSSSSMAIGTRTFRIEDTERLKTVDLYTFEVDEIKLLHASKIPESSTTDGRRFSTYKTAPIREGVIKNGILYNPINGEPAVLIDKGPFSLNGGTTQHSLPSWYLEIPKYINGYSSGQNKMAVLYGAGICLQSQVLKTQHGSNGDRWDEVLIHVLDLEGNFLGTKKVLQKPASERNEPPSVLAAATNHVFLAQSNKIYSFNASDFSSSTKDPVSIPKSGLQFVPKQTTFCVHGGDADIELHHTVLGGKAPFNFFDTNSNKVSGLQLNAETGVATLNVTEFMAKAKEALVTHFTGDWQSGGEYGLLAASRKESEPVMNIKNCLNSSELPVSREISLQVIDQNGDTASIAYYVFIGIPYEDVAPLVEEWKQSTAEKIESLNPISNGYDSVDEVPSEDTDETARDDGIKGFERWQNQGCAVTYSKYVVFLTAAALWFY